MRCDVTLGAFSRTRFMKLLFVAPELYPYAKTGGLGDVAGALPRALATLGVDARTLVPGYRSVLAATQRRPVAEFVCAALNTRAQISEVIDAAPSILVLEHRAYYDRNGGPYQGPDGDWPDNAERFALLCHAAAALCAPGLLPDWHAEIVHCNDWQSALVPALLHYGGNTAAQSIMTIHNLAFQGLFPRETLSRIGLPDHAFAIDGVEFYGQISFLKAGLVYADKITTVSPSYAEEIQQPELGFGLDGVLRARSADLCGILNGIDEHDWDPRNDAALVARYGSDSLDNKSLNKPALQAEFGLPVDDECCLLGMVSRIGLQKGSDLVAAIIPELATRPLQLVILGSGDHTIEQQLVDASAEWPQQIALHTGYDERLAHLIEAGSDLFLMPSRFEPCGLNQMYSMRYGTPPIVHAVGGLRDTVFDPSEAGFEHATGFTFAPAEAPALLAAIDRALGVWRDVRLFRRLQYNGMERDFSWRASAQQYLALYHSLRAS